MQRSVSRHHPAPPGAHPQLPQRSHPAPAAVHGWQVPSLAPLHSQQQRPPRHYDQSHEAFDEQQRAETLATRTQHAEQQYRASAASHSSTPAAATASSHAVHSSRHAAAASSVAPSSGPAAVAASNGVARGGSNLLARLRSSEAAHIGAPPDRRSPTPEGSERYSSDPLDADEADDAEALRMLDSAAADDPASHRTDALRRERDRALRQLAADESDLRRLDSSSPSSSAAPALVVRVTMDAGRVGEIPVWPGSDALELARAFCGEHGLPPGKAEPLARSIRQQLDLLQRSEAEADEADDDEHDDDGGEQDEDEEYRRAEEEYRKMRLHQEAAHVAAMHQRARDEEEARRAAAAPPAPVPAKPPQSAPPAPTAPESESVQAADPADNAADDESLEEEREEREEELSDSALSGSDSSLELSLDSGGSGDDEPAPETNKKHAPPAQAAPLAAATAPAAAAATQQQRSPPHAHAQPNGAAIGDDDDDVPATVRLGPTPAPAHARRTDEPLQRHKPARIPAATPTSSSAHYKAARVDDDDEDQRTPRVARPSPSAAAGNIAATASRPRPRRRAEPRTLDRDRSRSRSASNTRRTAHNGARSTANAHAASSGASSRRSSVGSAAGGESDVAENLYVPYASSRADVPAFERLYSDSVVRAAHLSLLRRAVLEAEDSLMSPFRPLSRSRTIVAEARAADDGLPVGQRLHARGMELLSSRRARAERAEVDRLERERDAGLGECTFAPVISGLAHSIRREGAFNFERITDADGREARARREEMVRREGDRPRLRAGEEAPTYAPRINPHSASLALRRAEREEAERARVLLVLAEGSEEEKRDLVDSIRRSSRRSASDSKSVRPASLRPRRHALSLHSVPLLARPFPPIADGLVPAEVERVWARCSAPSQERVVATAAGKWAVDSSSGRASWLPAASAAAAGSAVTLSPRRFSRARAVFTVLDSEREGVLDAQCMALVGALHPMDQSVVFALLQRLADAQRKERSMALARAQRIPFPRALRVVEKDEVRFGSPTPVFRLLFSDFLLLWHFELAALWRASNDAGAWAGYDLLEEDTDELALHERTATDAAPTRQGVYAARSSGSSRASSRRGSLLGGAGSTPLALHPAGAQSRSRSQSQSSRLDGHDRSQSRASSRDSSRERGRESSLHSSRRATLPHETASERAQRARIDFEAQLAARPVALTEVTPISTVADSGSQLQSIASPLSLMALASMELTASRAGSEYGGERAAVDPLHFDADVHAPPSPSRLHFIELETDSPAELNDEETMARRENIDGEY